MQRVTSFREILAGFLTSQPEGAFLNFICVLHLRELVPSREHKTEAKQTCNKIILLGWVRSCLITWSTPTSIQELQRGTRSQGELKVAGLTAVDLLKQRYRKQTLKKEARYGAITNDLRLSCCIVCDVQYKHVLFSSVKSKF